MPVTPLPKHQRLLVEGGLRPMPAPVTHFKAHGATGIYDTFVGAHVQVCTCPASRRCYHIDAAVEYLNATPEERVMLDGAIDRAVSRADADAALVFDSLAL